MQSAMVRVALWTSRLFEQSEFRHRMQNATIVASDQEWIGSQNVTIEELVQEWIVSGMDLQLFRRTRRYSMIWFRSGLVQEWICFAERGDSRIDLGRSNDWPVLILWPEDAGM